jgi:hypothetical protein
MFAKAYRVQARRTTKSLEHPLGSLPVAKLYYSNKINRSISGSLPRYHFIHRHSPQPEAIMTD